MTSNESNEWLILGATVYIAGIILNAVPPGELELLRGVVVGLDSDTVHVEVSREGTCSRLTVLRRNIFHDEHAARERLLAKRLYDQRSALLAAVPNISDAYLSAIKPNAVVCMSGNPLRIGEPNVAFAAQSNAFGREDNAQKCLMIAGSIWQDIRVLFSLLFLISFASEYAKKVAGKYIVIELQSLRHVLGRLQTFEPRYPPLFKRLESQLGRLDQEFRYPTLRNKILAHRDGDLDLVQVAEFWKKITRYNLQRHLDAFSEHLGEMNLLFPQEMAQYFNDPIPMPALTPSRFDNNGDWEPFDPPKFDNTSKF